MWAKGELIVGARFAANGRQIDRHMLCDAWSTSIYHIPPTGTGVIRTGDPKKPPVTRTKFHLEGPIRAESFAMRPLALPAIELLDPITREGDFQCRRCTVAVSCYRHALLAFAPSADPMPP